MHRMLPAVMWRAVNGPLIVTLGFCLIKSELKVRHMETLLEKGAHVLYIGGHVVTFIYLFVFLKLFPHMVNLIYGFFTCGEIKIPLKKRKNHNHFNLTI